VIDASRTVKDAAWIAETHKECAEELMHKFQTPLYGMVMDNASANVAAMKKLQDHFSTSVIVGCAAHATDLFMKVGGCNYVFDY
jgi:hypothetical protein